jgi:hypothetical protein
MIAQPALPFDQWPVAQIFVIDRELVKGVDRRASAPKMTGRETQIVALREQAASSISWRERAKKSVHAMLKDVDK